jgi:cardiolipin synthase
MDVTNWLPLLAPIAHWSIVIGLGARIIWLRRPPEVSLAWLVVLAALPFAGAFVYLLVGEMWLGGRRARLLRAMVGPMRERIAALPEMRRRTWTTEDPTVRALSGIAEHTGIMPVLPGNDVELVDGADPFFERLLEDIEGAEQSLELLFYIWEPRGRVVEVQEALMRAAARGVRCRVIVDGAGGRPLIRSDAWRRLKEAGVETAVALPVKWLRVRLSRIDLRNHRKLVVVDDRVAYVGSMNMADPKHFKAKAGVGEWVDVMARLRGPTVALLATLFDAEWIIEAGGDETPPWNALPDPAGPTPVQVVPSGPGQTPQALHRMLLAAVHGADRSLTLTTPYFIPDEAMLTALVSAALRGVEVTIVVPEKIDSRLVALASNAYFESLVEAGVRVVRFEEGLLHSKTAVVDEQIALIGTANMDRRSFWINFELSVFSYDAEVAGRLMEIQRRYIERGHDLRESAWGERSRPRRLAENAAQMLAPLL